jgi:hypothetical protein
LHETTNRNTAVFNGFLQYFALVSHLQRVIKCLACKDDKNVRCIKIQVVLLPTTLYKYCNTFKPVTLLQYYCYTIIVTEAL